LSPKNGLLGQRPGPGKDGQNNAKTPLLLTSTPEKFFFFDFDSKTCWIRRGFEQLSSSSSWRFMVKKRGCQYVGSCGR